MEIMNSTELQKIEMRGFTNKVEFVFMELFFEKLTEDSFNQK